MNKKFISVIVTLAMLCAQITQLSPVSAADSASQPVYSCDFSRSEDISGFSVYDSANDEYNKFYDSDNQRLGISYGDENHSWDDNNGIKTDITDALKDCASGDTITVSVDFTSTWWNDPVTKAKVFLEVVKGNAVNKTMLYEGPDSVSSNSGTVTLSGETNAYTYEEGSTVYLCITQNSGTHYYDNISVSVKSADATSSDEEFIINDNFDDNSSAGYEVYDRGNTQAQISANGNLEISFGDDYSWDESNGFRKDITSLVESGTEYEASADVNAYWGDGGTAAAKMFFEIVSSNNPQKQISIGGASNAAAGTTDGTVTVSGSAKLEFNTGDTVYLCVTQNSGYHKYDNILVKAKADTPETTPNSTPESTPDNNELLNDTFADGQTTGYAVYDSSDTGAEISANGGLNINFGNDSSANNGFRKDITGLVRKKGISGKYTASADVLSFYWNGNKARLFFEVVSGSRTRQIQIADGEPAEGNSISLTGTANLRYNEGDTVYLCVTQFAGYNNYNNIKLSYVGEADAEPEEPEATEMPSVPEEPVPADAIFYDNFSSADQKNAYELYDGSNDIADAGISIDNGELAAYMGAGNGWNDANGIRRDITEYVKQYISGVSFRVQLDMMAYWGDTNDVAGSLFFEVVGADGSVNTADIAEILPTSGDKASVNASARLSYKNDDKIYLCVTQKSGNHRYDNVAMWFVDDGIEGIIPLTSGQRYAGNYFPESSKAIFKHTFGGNAEAEAAQYSSYNSVEYDSDKSYIGSGGAYFVFPEGGTSMRGVKVDITEQVEANIPNGGDVRITCKMLPWYWWGPASVKVKAGDAITNIETYTSKQGSPDGKWVTIGDIVNLKRNPGEKVELIIVMDSSSATGIGIDDVCVELPYGDITARDIAVSDISKLDEVDKISIVYGGEFITESDVVWEKSSSPANVVYGTTSIDGVTARAVITDKAVKVTVTPDNIIAESAALEYGKTAVATGANEMVFLLDSLDNMNLISTVSGTGAYASPSEGTTDLSVKMSVKDNGNGITIEGTDTDAAYNEKIILIKDEDGELVKAVYVSLDEEGKYSADESGLKSGKYTAIMTDTGTSTEFSYATETEFEKLRSKMTDASAISSLLADEANRNILGANTYEQLDKLSLGAKTRIYNSCASSVSSLTRPKAIELFDALVTIQSAESSITEAEWTEMLEKSSEILGLKGTNIYEQYKDMPAAQRGSVKSKIAAQSISDTSGFYSAFAGAVLNTALMNAGQYTKVQSVLKENSDLFAGTGVDVSNISINAAQYVNKNISASDTSISSIAALVRNGNASSEGNTAITNGLSGGGGGGGGGSLSGALKTTSSPGGISGTNIGLGAEDTKSTVIDVTKPYDLPAGNASEGVVFRDLAGYGWAVEAINSLANKGIINGYGDGTFHPGENITREAFVQIIVTALNIPPDKPEFEFDDVASDRWSHDVIASAAAAGIVAGISESEFAPEANITRQDAAVIIYRAMIFKGFSLQEGDLIFADSDDIADYAKEAVAALSAEEVINGMEDGSFAPASAATRAQAAIMIDKIVSSLTEG